MVSLGSHGEVLTENEAAERFRLEEIERKRKREEKKKGKGRGRGKGKGRGKGASNRSTAEDELPVVGKRKKTQPAKKNLNNIFDHLIPPSSDSESDGEDAHTVAMAALDVRKKAATGCWSDDSDSGGENGLSFYREDLGLCDSDDDALVVQPTGTRSRPLSAPLPGSPKAGPSRIKEQWLTTVSCQSSSNDELQASQDSDDMFEVTDDGDAPIPVDDDGDASIHVDDDGVEFKPNVTYVIVDYEGTKFPGLFEKMVEGQYQVSCMRRNGKFWVFDQDKPDIFLYDRPEIVEIIKPPTLINNRNCMFVEEAEKYWN